ncbi:hypothetical protein XGA_2760 [Xanthomonas hortorum ATCC 19865]|nr:hypothetical protein XGA_2760 [Xanthomonas hortorum ATCC 19865]
MRYSAADAQGAGSVLRSRACLANTIGMQATPSTSRA